MIIQVKTAPRGDAGGVGNLVRQVGLAEDRLVVLVAETQVQALAGIE